MNRFYKPQARQYVSSYVDMPWEFLQGVAEQKQKGYDTALASADAASKLLDFKVNPGDMAGKKQVQNEYNERILKGVDHIRNTGDFNSGARDVANIIRDIVQDPRIQVMTGAVEPYSKQAPAIEKMKQENKLLKPWQSNWNPMYSTYNPETGELRPYNQDVGYETPDFYKYLNESFGTLKLSESGKSYEVIDPVSGVIRKISNSGGQITDNDIMARARESLYNYKSTAGYFDDKNQAKYLLENNIAPDKYMEEYKKDPNQAMLMLSDDIAVNKLYKHGRDQIINKSTSGEDISFMPEYAFDRYNTVNQGMPVQDVALNLSGKTFDQDKLSYRTQESSPSSTTREEGKWSERYVLPEIAHNNGILSSNEWHTMGTYFMKTDRELFKKLFINKNATNQELKQAYDKFSKFYNTINANVAAGSSAITVDATKNTKKKFGEENPSLGVVMGTAGYDHSTYLYNPQNNEFITIAQLIQNNNENTNIKATFNKETTPYNVIPYLAEENNIPDPQRFIKSLGFTIVDKKTNKTETYYLPEINENIKDNDVIINNMYLAKVKPLTPVPITFTKGNKTYTKYVEFEPDTFDELELRKQGAQMKGKYIVYNTKDEADRKYKGNLLLNPKESNIYTSDPVNVFENILLKVD